MNKQKNNHNEQLIKPDLIHEEFEEFMIKIHHNNNKKNI